ncbi:MAG: recombinase family protein [Chloroflexi bacterium]|nr:recombinase family protein [Chloroflexota bacterium]
MNTEATTTAHGAGGSATAGRPIAYLRRSSHTTAGGAGAVSYEVQQEAVRALAARYGDPDPHLMVDWNISGRRADRREYQKLCTAVETGQASSVYAYSLSRLGRSTVELLRLMELCAAKRVPVRLAKEGDLDPTTSHGRLYLTVLAAVATFESEVASERGRDRTAAMREQGAFVGKPSYGWVHGTDGRLVPVPDEQAVIQQVLQEYARTHSYREVARILNGAGIPTPTAKRGERGASDHWKDGTVKRIVTRGTGPGIPEQRDRTRKGSRRLPTAAFQRLLRCAECDGTMTSATKHYRTADGAPHVWVGYVCQRARLTSGHGRAMVADATVREWAREELGFLRLRKQVEDTPEDVEQQRAVLDAQLGRIVEMREDGLITRAESQERAAKVNAARAALEARAVVTRVPRADWNWPAEDIQPVLAALWEHVTVDCRNPDETPHRRGGHTFTAEWRDRSMRRTDEEVA